MIPSSPRRDHCLSAVGKGSRLWSRLTLSGAQCSVVNRTSSSLAPFPSVEIAATVLRDRIAATWFEAGYSTAFRSTSATRPEQIVRPSLPALPPRTPEEDRAADERTENPQRIGEVGDAVRRDDGLVRGSGSTAARVTGCAFRPTRRPSSSGRSRCTTSARAASSTTRSARPTSPHVRRSRRTPTARWISSSGRRRPRVKRATGCRRRRGSTGSPTCASTRPLKPISTRAGSSVTSR